MRRLYSIKTVGLMLILIGSLGLGSWVFAQPDATAYPDLKTAGPVSRVVQAVTGFTPVSGWVANRVLRREIAQHVQGHLHTHLRLFSGTDLIAGKARGVTLSGKNLLLNGFIPLSEFTFASQPDMPLFVSKGKRPILLRPVTFHMTMVLSEQDINRMLTSAKGQQILTNMRVKLPPFGTQSFDAMNPAVKLDGDRVNINALMNLHGAPAANALPMTVSGKLVPDQSSLALSDLNLQIEGIQNTQDIAQVVEHYFNDLVNFNHIKVQRHRLKVQIEQAQVQGQKVNLAATLTVTPDPKALKAALAEQAN